MKMKHHLQWMAALGLCAAVLLPAQGVLAKKAMAPQKARDLSTRLDAMVGHDGTHVPGLGVEVYKKSERKSYTHFAGHGICEKPARKTCRFTADTRFRAASVSKDVHRVHHHAAGG